MEAFGYKDDLTETQIASQNALQLIAFSVGEQTYGVEITTVREISRLERCDAAAQYARLCARGDQPPRHDRADLRSSRALARARPHRPRTTSWW